ncbi:MAG: putative ABC transport system ATP-binding protein [Saprospiraceae bacterium]|jgi:putative ABC transport system ATP-binding protein
MQETIIKSIDLRKSYQTGKTEVPVINGINISLYKGDFTVIMGSSGSGKSTLLYLLSGLEVPSSGEIWLEDKPVHSMDEKMMTLIRREYIGFVFQDFNLVPNLTFLENVLIPAYLVKNDRKALKERAKGLMAKMDILDLIDRLPSEVSGGQQQRCSMARAIINNPRVVMADEPTGNLNSSSSESVLNILTELNETGQSIIMVTHEVKSACRANRIIFLKDGQIEDELNFEKEQSTDDKEVQLLQWLAGKDW